MKLVSVGNPLRIQGDSWLPNWKTSGKGRLLGLGCQVAVDSELSVPSIWGIQNGRGPFRWICGGWDLQADCCEEWLPMAPPVIHENVSWMTNVRPIGGLARCIKSIVINAIACRVHIRNDHFRHFGISCEWRSLRHFGTPEVASISGRNWRFDVCGARGVARVQPKALKVSSRPVSKKPSPLGVGMLHKREFLGGPSCGALLLGARVTVMDSCRTKSGIRWREFRQPLKRSAAQANHRWRCQCGPVSTQQSPPSRAVPLRDELLDSIHGGPG